ncbi:MAG: hypothetical protein KGY41_10245 [Desulfovermiculus sp.]|nr:hypothetical protein [Desulfovermiculus sp.]
MSRRCHPGFWASLLPLWALLGLIVGLQACAPLAGPRPETSPSLVNQVWQRFRQDFAPRGYTPFWLKASLNYSGPEESRRSTFELWGNTGLPLRLDLKAGLGMTVSLWRIDTHGLLAYYPDHETAYTHPDSGLALKRLGFPSPLSMQELAQVLTGQTAACLPPSFEQAIPQSDEHIEYRFSASSRVQSLVLDQRGQVISMAGSQPFSWTIKLSDYQEDSQILVARTYRLETPQHKAVVRIKDIRFRSQPWPEKALTLPLPDKTTLRPMGE